MVKKCQAPLAQTGEGGAGATLQLPLIRNLDLGNAARDRTRGNRGWHA